MLELHLFERVADALHALLPDDLGPWHQRNHRYGLKLWFGTAAKPDRVHYEAQVVGAGHVPGARTLALEVGLHAEHPEPDRNDAVLAALTAATVERRWRKALGSEPVAGPFLGRDGWVRLSETWPDPDLGDPDLPLELAARLTDFAVALQPSFRQLDQARSVTM